MAALSMMVNHRYNGIIGVFLSCVVCLFASVVYAGQDKADTPLVRWPLPPAKTRFVYVKSIYGEPEAKGGGFFSGLAGLLFGDEPPKHFRRPYDIAVADSGLLVVTDPGAGAIHIINPQNGDYHFIQQVGDRRLLSPIGVAFTEQGQILVTDSEARAIYRLTPDGEKLGQINDQTLQRPTDIGIDPVTKHIFVIDTPAHTIHIYDQAGHKIQTFGRRGNRPGEFNYPTHLAFNQQGELYVTDSMNFRVQVFDTQLRPKAQFGKLGDRLGEFSKPKGIALDRDNNIYVVDSQFDYLLIYDRQGRFLLPIGGHGRGPGLFNIPTGVAVSQHLIYIVDSYNQRVQILKRVG